MRRVSTESCCPESQPGMMAMNNSTRTHRATRYGIVLFLFYLQGAVMEMTVPVIAGEEENQKPSYAERYREINDPADYRQNYRENYRQNQYYVTRSNRNNRLYPGERWRYTREALEANPSLVERGRRRLNVPSTGGAGEPGSTEEGTPGRSGGGNAGSARVGGGVSWIFLRPPSLLYGYLSGQIRISSATGEITEASPFASTQTIMTETLNSPAVQTPKELLFQEGLEAFRQRRYASAKARFEEMMEIVKPNDDLAVAYALSLFATRNYEPAWETLRMVMEQIHKENKKGPSLLDYYDDLRDFQVHLQRLEQFVEKSDHLENEENLLDLLHAMYDGTMQENS